MARRALIGTTHGLRHEAFGPQEWVLVTSVAAIWGSSFVFIEVAIDHLEPGLVAFGRVAIGMVTLSTVRRARRAGIERADCRGSRSSVCSGWVRLCSCSRRASSTSTPRWPGC